MTASTFARDGVFAKYEAKVYPFRFHGQILVELLAGGTPTNADVAEAWIKAKGYVGNLKDDLIREQVAEVMRERGVDEAAAVEEVAKNRHLSGFKRELFNTESGARFGELYIEGRQLKACLKEAASVAADAGNLKPRGHGMTNARKGIISFMSEHVFVVERKLHLGVTEPTDVLQSFISTFRGSGIQYSEIVENAMFDFTVESDKDFSEEEWAMMWVTAQNQGVGAMRSQGFGRFTVMEWEPVAKVKPLRQRKAA